MKILADKQFDFKKEARDGGEQDKELRFKVYAVTTNDVHVFSILQNTRQYMHMIQQTVANLVIWH